MARLIWESLANSLGFRKFLRERSKGRRGCAAPGLTTADASRRPIYRRRKPRRHKALFGSPMAGRSGDNSFVSLAGFLVFVVSLAPRGNSPVLLRGQFGRRWSRTFDRPAKCWLANSRATFHNSGARRSIVGPYRSITRCWSHRFPSRCPRPSECSDTAAATQILALRRASRLAQELACLCLRHVLVHPPRQSPRCHASGEASQHDESRRRWHAPGLREQTSQDVMSVPPNSPSGFD